MRGPGMAALAASFCLSAATAAGAQSAPTWGRPPSPRAPLVPLRPELLRPVGTPKLEDLRVRREPQPAAARPAPAPPAHRPAAPVRVCPMPIARPDTASLEHMPIDRRDSAYAAAMPLVGGCRNPLSR
jgi:hypothetical protein